MVLPLRFLAVALATGIAGLGPAQILARPQGRPNLPAFTVARRDLPLFVYDEYMHGGAYGMFGFSDMSGAGEFLSPCEAGVTGMAIDKGGHQYYSYWYGQTGTGVALCNGGFLNPSRTRFTGPLKSAQGVALDSAGRIYVVDSELCAVFRIDDIAGHGLVRFGSPGAGQGQFMHPHGIAIDRFDRVFIADTGNSRIACFSNMSASGWQTYDGAAYGGVGAQVLYPHQIAVDGRARIYYLRPEGGKVVRVDDMSGRGMVQYGSPSSRDTILNNPGGVAIDAYNRIYISDTDGRRVVRLDEMTGAGRVELNWDREPDKLLRPTLLCVGRQPAAPAPRIR